MATLAAPKAVSPLIKATRYTALIAGILYGRKRLRDLTAEEEVIQKRENEIRARIAERERIAKEKRAMVEMNNLAVEAGVTPK